MPVETPTAGDVELLRTQHYNSQVVGVTHCGDDLMILRVRPDRGIPPFRAGQYTVLGLGRWEERAAGCQAETAQADPVKLIKRAYSLASSMLDAEGNLLAADGGAYLEFFIALVRSTEKHPPELTPRLFALRRGDRLFCGPHMHGNYTLDRIGRDANVVLAATGVGEAPHNAMIVKLLAGGYRGRVTAVTCARYQRDLAYQSTHRRLEKRFPRYRYLTLTTREPENLDASLATYVGRKYLQEYFENGEFERDADLTLQAGNTHVFLCGSPDMIGVPHQTHDPARRYPSPRGMVEILEQRGFRVDQPHQPGTIHFEKYW